jgi:hypothetical protein
MSSMRFSARLDTSNHGPSHPCKDAGAVSCGLTFFKNAMVKSLRCQQESHSGVPTGKIQRIQMWRGAWRPCSGSSSAYPSVMTSPIARSTSTHVRYVTHELNISGHMLMWIIFLVLCVELVPKFARNFQLRSIYWNVCSFFCRS